MLGDCNILRFKQNGKWFWTETSCCGLLLLNSPWLTSGSHSEKIRSLLHLVFCAPNGSAQQFSDLPLTPVSANLNAHFPVLVVYLIICLLSLPHLLLQDSSPRSNLIAVLLTLIKKDEEVRLLHTTVCMRSSALLWHSQGGLMHCRYVRPLLQFPWNTMLSVTYEKSHVALMTVYLILPE